MKLVQFNSIERVDSVSIAYLNDNGMTQTLLMESTNHSVWTVQFLEGIRYFAYLVDGKDWVCDRHYNVKQINNTYYSDITDKKKPTTLSVEKAVLCKNFNSEDFSPIGITTVFTKLDVIMGFWARLNNVNEHSIVHFQMIDPDNILYNTYEVLTAVKRESTFYFGVQITHQFVEGKYKFRLLYNEDDMMELSCVYKSLKTSYGSSQFNTHLHQSNNLIDIKY